MPLGRRLVREKCKEKCTERRVYRATQRVRLANDDNQKIPPKKLVTSPLVGTTLRRITTLSAHRRGVGLTRPPSPSPGVPRARCPPVARPRIPRDRVRPRVRGAHPVGRPARGVLRGSVGAAERRREDDAGARGVRGESAVAPRDVRRTAPRLERRRVHEGVATRPRGRRGGRARTPGGNVARPRR